jgi:hypothetical protein
VDQSVDNPGRPGRPSRFNAAIASTILRLVREGEYPAVICRQPGFPSVSTLYRWREHNEVFARQYALAREFHAETLADKIRETIDGADGCTMEEIQVRRLKFDGYRYLAGKYFPRMFGDKLLHTGGDGEGPVAVKLTHNWALLTMQKQAQLIALIEEVEALERKADGKVIEVEAEDDDDEP